MVTISTSLILLYIGICSPPAARPENGNWPKLLHTLKWYSEGLAFSPDSKTLAIVGPALVGNVQKDRDIFLWDVATRRDRLRMSGQAGVQAVAFSPDGKLLASGGADLRLWAVDSGKERQRIKSDTFPEIFSVAFSPDGSLLVSGSRSNVKRSSNTVGLWKIDTLKNCERGPEYTRDAKNVTFSSDGKILAYTGMGDGKIHLWDVEGEIERGGIDMGTAPRRTSVTFSAVAFSPDSKTLAVCVWYGPPPRNDAAPSRGWSEKDIHLWSLATEKCDKLVGHENQVRAIAFSPDGKYLVSSGEDMRIWDLATKQVLVTLKETPDTLIISPDGKLLVKANRGLSIKLWSFERKK